jgi:hypothetical protein
VRDFRGGTLTYDSHNGTDFAVPPGTIVVAAAPGRVLRASSEFNRGGLKVFVDATSVMYLQGAVVDYIETLEGAGFISAYDRTIINRIGVPPPELLDERVAQEIAVKQGVGVVLAGSVTRQGRGYTVAVHATQPVTGEVIATAQDTAPDKNQVLAVATGLATSVRKALGDDTSDSAQRFAMETLTTTSLDAVRDYAMGQEALSNNRWAEARQNFAKAVPARSEFRRRLLWHGDHFAQPGTTSGGGKIRQRLCATSIG